MPDSCQITGGLGIFGIVRRVVCLQAAATMQNPRPRPRFRRHFRFSRARMFALLAACVCMACIVIPLTAQDVTVMPPVLFDVVDKTYQPVQPDTPPTLLKKWSPPFPSEYVFGQENKY